MEWLTPTILLLSCGLNNLHSIASNRPVTVQASVSSLENRSNFTHSFNNDSRQQSQPEKHMKNSKTGANQSIDEVLSNAHQVFLESPLISKTSENSTSSSHKFKTLNCSYYPTASRHTENVSRLTSLPQPVFGTIKSDTCKSEIRFEFEQGVRCEDEPPIRDWMVIAEKKESYVIGDTVSYECTGLYDVTDVPSDVVRCCGERDSITHRLSGRWRGDGPICRLTPFITSVCVISGCTALLFIIAFLTRMLGCCKQSIQTLPTDTHPYPTSRSSIPSTPAILNRGHYRCLCCSKNEETGEGLLTDDRVSLVECGLNFGSGSGGDQYDI